MNEFRLHQLPYGARLGLLCLCLTLIGGFAAAAAYVVLHHQRKDEEPGLSVTDLRGAYHGVNKPAPMLSAMQRGHPEGLPAPVRDALTAWLKSDKINTDYDNLDLGDKAPAELIAANCVSCHARSASAKYPVAARIPLENWDDVRKVVFSKKLDPPGLEILVVSTHTHALSLACVAGLITFMLVATRWPRPLVGWVAGLMCATLFLDLGAWWASRQIEAAVYVVIAAGAAYSGLSCMALAMIIIDLLRPAPPRN